MTWKKGQLLQKLDTLNVALRIITRGLNINGSNNMTAELKNTDVKKNHHCDRKIRCLN